MDKKAAETLIQGADELVKRTDNLAKQYKTLHKKAKAVVEAIENNKTDKKKA